VRWCDGRGKEFWLQKPIGTWVVHGACGARQKRRKVLPRLWLDAHWEWGNGCDMCVHGWITSGLKMLERKRIDFILCHDGSGDAGIVGVL
jgi:hypothetical protein